MARILILEDDETLSRGIAGLLIGLGHEVVDVCSLAGVARTSLDGRILEVNPAFARMLGYRSPEQLSGASLGALYPSWSRLREFLETLRFRREVPAEECELLGADGCPSRSSSARPSSRSPSPAASPSSRRSSTGVGSASSRSAWNAWHTPTT